MSYVHCYVHVSRCVFIYYITLTAALLSDLLRFTSLKAPRKDPQAVPICGPQKGTASAFMSPNSPDVTLLFFGVISLRTSTPVPLLVFGGP